MTFFTPSENNLKVLTFKVAAPEAVTVPAGTFQAFRIDVTGSRVPFTLWVTTTTPRRIVKTEFVGQPFVVELVKSGHGRYQACGNCCYCCSPSRVRARRVAPEQDRRRRRLRPPRRPRPRRAPA